MIKILILTIYHQLIQEISEDYIMLCCINWDYNKKIFSSPS